MANITGTIRVDVLDGTSSRDVIFGLAGGDGIHGLGGDDRIDAGDGSNGASGDDGDDYILGGRDDDLLHGGAGADLVFGRDGADEILGDSGSDRLYGADGDDLLIGGDGDDRLWGGSGADRLLGGAGNDLLVGGPGRDILGTALNQQGSTQPPGFVDRDVVMDFNPAEDRLSIRLDGQALVSDSDLSHFYLRVELPFAALDSNHDGTLTDLDQRIAIQPVTVDGLSALSTVIDLAGIQGDLAQSETLTVFGATGLTAASFDANRFAGARIEGSIGADVLVGTALDDPIQGYGGADRLDGQAGNDRVSGGKGDDLLNGGSGDDRLYGGDGADRLFGGAGRDFLFGDQDPNNPLPLRASADDHLFGGDGGDYLLAGLGSDVLEGGAGRDYFGVQGGGMLLDPNRPGVDVLVTDFTRGDDLMNEQSTSFEKYDANHDGLINRSDAYVTLQPVAVAGLTQISLVIHLHADDATVSTGKITLFGIHELDVADFGLPLF